jgi:hypothetical protein
MSALAGRAAAPCAPALGGGSVTRRPTVSPGDAPGGSRSLQRRGGQGQVRRRRGIRRSAFARGWVRPPSWQRRGEHTRVCPNMQAHPYQGAFSQGRPKVPAGPKPQSSWTCRRPGGIMHHSVLPAPQSRALSPIARWANAGPVLHMGGAGGMWETPRREVIASANRSSAITIRSGKSATARPNHLSSGALPCQGRKAGVPTPPTSARSPIFGWAPGATPYPGGGTFR